MTRSDAGATPPTVRRFTRAVRLVHWSVAVLMITCIGTAAVLYNGSLAVLVGHRRTVELIHVYAGWALPAPPLLGFWSRAYRADIRRLNRFTRSDRLWLRSRQRRDGGIPVGKFNAGQKLNAALSGGAILVLFGTGTVMYLTGLTPLAWRTGATFVHDWFALAVGLLVLGHVSYALKDRDAMQGMRTGTVPVHWAHAEHPRWAEEVTGPPGQPGPRPDHRARAGPP
ncbi:MAG TPA: cytochrome b/b6 domain-containing protein [Mycobacteriales bacterium]|nr:cytochrome b/b6 domain-containing protein [Mycobacteriales bacterium]